MKTSGGGKDFELVGDQVEAAPYGIAVAKSNTAAAGRPARPRSTRSSRTASTTRSSTKWGVEDGAVKEATVNGGK